MKVLESVDSLILGDRHERRLGVLASIVVGLGTFVGYAIGVFGVEGGVIFLPGDATAVGMIMSVSLGYRKQPLLVSWIAVFGSYFGFNADWAFFGLSSRSLAEKTAFLLDPESLFVFSVAAVVFGTLGFGVGYVAALVVEYLR